MFTWHEVIKSVLAIVIPLYAFALAGSLLVVATPVVSGSGEAVGVAGVAAPLADHVVSLQDLAGSAVWTGTDQPIRQVSH